MADKTDKVKNNVSGKYYVDSNCMIAMSAAKPHPTTSRPTKMRDTHMSSASRRTPRNRSNVGRPWSPARSKRSVMTAMNRSARYVTP